MFSWAGITTRRDELTVDMLALSSTDQQLNVASQMAEPPKLFAVITHYDVININQDKCLSNYV